MPVAENLIEVAQVAGGGIRRFNRVAALVEQRVHLQSVLLACGEHELPETSCTDARHSLRVECRLDDGQVLQFQRQTISLQCLLENGHEEILCAQHDGYGAAQASAVAVDELLHNFVPRHLYSSRQLLQSLHELLLAVFGVDVRHVARAVGLQEVLRVVQVEQTIDLEGQSFGNIDFDIVVLVVIVVVDDHDVFIADDVVLIVVEIFVFLIDVFLIFIDVVFLIDIIGVVDILIVFVVFIDYFDIVVGFLFVVDYYLCLHAEWK